MQRPQYVSDAIKVTDRGVHVGTYGPLELHSAYQPIFGFRDGQLEVEAWEGLIRPKLTGEGISPGDLFAHADPEDALFVECMCRALHLRNYPNARPAGRDLFINVNPAIYESVEVIEREFTFMFSILEKYGLSPQLLVCEVVEEAEVSTEVMVRLCHSFRAHGARIALDDFGSGSSGAERYMALAPEVVKIDGEMFRRLSAERTGRRLLLSLGRTFAADHTQLLVEGIETGEHLEIAAEIGASLVQGYGLAPPVVLPIDAGSIPIARLTRRPTAVAI